MTPISEMRLNSLNRDMFKPFRSRSGCSAEFLVVCWRICTGLKGVSFRETHLKGPNSVTATVNEIPPKLRAATAIGYGNVSVL